MSGAYYNEFDPGAAAWLRELIKAGLIADGDVDERSILDVRHSELRSYTQCHFFAGIGGWSYALRLAGWPDDRPVWTGSPPCQPFSPAGRKLGRDDARHLAPHFISLVGAARPGVLFGEQVASADVFGKAAKRARGNFVAPPQWAWLDDLSDRLEAARYAVGASDFPSAGVGAPHIRQRTFFGAVCHEWMADNQLSSSARHGQHGGTGSPEGGIRCGSANSGGPSRLGHSSGAGLEGCDARTLGRELTAVERTGAICPVRLADQQGCGRREERQDSRGGAFGDCPEGFAAGLSAGRGDSGLADKFDRRRQFEPSEEPAGILDAQVRSSAQGREPRTVCSSLCGEPATGPLHGFWRDADWLLCRDGKWRPVEPGTFPLAHGVSGRVGLLRGYGNAINPHAAAEFIRAFGEAADGMRMAS